MPEDQHQLLANEAERRRWNDDRWTSVWPERERLTTSVTPYLVDVLALKPGESVVDIGCGGGGTTLACAQAVAPAGRVVGVDISHALVALAAERTVTSGLTNINFQIGDCQDEPLMGGPFDVATSQFGVMFFDEPVRAFANIGAHLRPDGRLVFACWQAVQRNPWHVGAALRSLVPPVPPLAPGKHAVGPFVLGDMEDTGAILGDAGFRDVRFTGYDITVDGPASAIFDDALLGLMGIPAEHFAGAKAAAVEHLEKFRINEREFRYPLSFFVIEAIKG